MRLDSIPSLLSAMGVLNTVLVFVYSTVLNRVATLSRRRLLFNLFLALAIAMGCLIFAYIFQPEWWWFTAIHLVKLGLAIWFGAFVWMMLIVRAAIIDSVHGQTPLADDVRFEDRAAKDDLGIPIIDRAIAHNVALGRRVYFPVLLIHDIESPGLTAARKYMRRALSQNEGVIYFTFSRPHSTIAKQLLDNDTGASLDRLWIIDGYSRIYLPEAEKAYETATKNKKAGRKPLPKVIFTDARNPSDVYRGYAEALGAAKKAGVGAMRSIYETLSDFVKIADVDLVFHYLRRVVVLEEKRNIRAMYLVWDGSIQGGLDQRYLQWFFNTTVTMTKKSSPVPCFNVQFDRLLPERMSMTTNSDLEYLRNNLFRIDLERVMRVAQTIVPLGFEPRPYGFLAGLRHGADFPEQLANFLFYMVAIDHDTHRANARYEDIIDGAVVHGSDLLYHLAGRAKENDPSLFLAPSFASITEAAVRKMFTTPNGRIPADVEGRTDIFNSCAKGLLADYQGDAGKLLDATRGRLGDTGGLFQRLEGFSAYRDPVGKKAHLLIKVLRREQLFDPVDKHLIRASIDHVVMTIALRSGMIVCEDAELAKSLAAGDQVDAHSVEVLREATAEAVTSLARAANTPEDELDDLIWSYGRKSLRQPTPLEADDVHSELDSALRGAGCYRVDFVKAINGVGLPSAIIPTIRVPFTRYY